MEGISRHLLDNEQWVGDSVGAAPALLSSASQIIFLMSSSVIYAKAVKMGLRGTVEQLRLRFRTTVSRRLELWQAAYLMLPIVATLL